MVVLRMHVSAMSGRVSGPLFMFAPAHNEFSAWPSYRTENNDGRFLWLREMPTPSLLTFIIKFAKATAYGI